MKDLCRRGKFQKLHKTITFFFEIEIGKMNSPWKAIEERNSFMHLIVFYENIRYNQLRRR